MTDQTTTAPTGDVSTVQVLTLPALADVPRDNARDTVECAIRIATVVERWAPAAVEAVDFEGAAVMRRNVAALANTIARRELSKGATVIANRALRRVERVLGQTVRAAQEAGTVRTPGRPGPVAGVPSVWDVTGSVTHVFTFADDVTDEQFEHALGVASGGDRMCHISNVVDALAGTLPEPEPEPEPAPEPLDTTAALATVVAALEQVAQTHERIDVSTIEHLDPADAADTAAAMWLALVPIIGLRKRLIHRGQQ